MACFISGPYVRSAKILLDELAEVDFNFFLLCVDTPILSSATQFFGFADEDEGWI